MVLFISLATMKAQDTLWTRRFDQMRDEEASDITRDSSDNIISVGFSRDTLDSDILLLKYNQSGNLLWYRLFNTGQIDWGFCVTTDRNANIYVGSYHSNLSVEKPGITKFSQSGETIWLRMYPQLANFWMTGITLDSLNNIYCCGKGVTSPAAFLMKCDSIGNILWQRFYNWSDGQSFEDIAINNFGEIFVTGSIGAFALLTAKFNNNGDSIWSRTYSATSDSRGIILDHQGNVIVAGYVTNWITYDALIVKYSPTGNIIWDKILNYRPIDYLMKVGVDNDNNIFVSGASGITFDTLDYLLIKLSPFGETLWTASYNAGHNDCGTGVVIDRQNNPIITGKSSNGANYDVLTIKYSGSSGIEMPSSNIVQSEEFIRLFSNVIRNHRINLSILKPNSYQIALYDIQGKKIKVLQDGFLKQGEYSYNLSSVVAGIYFLKIKTKDYNETKKILLVK